MSGDQVTTNWRCERCQATGKITLERHAGVWEGFNAVLEAHDVAAPTTCTGGRGDIRVWIGDPPPVFGESIFKILERVLAGARERLPANTVARDVTMSTDPAPVTFEFVTEYPETLCRPEVPPIARTTGVLECSDRAEADVARVVQRKIAEHFALLADVYAGRYK